MPVTLTVIAGPQAGRRFSFDRHETFLIGRSPEAHFSLPDDDYFSRMHCLLEVNPPRCRLTDLTSRNGTYLNGQRVQEAELKDGDEIRGGMTVLRVAVSDSAPNATLDLEPAGADSGDWGTVAPEQPALPELPGYRLMGVLGSGGMGTVYRAVSRADGTEVAVKTIKTGAAAGSPAVARFVREAEILKRLRHPNIVGYAGAGAEGGLAYFAMELVPGTDLGGVLQKEGPLEVRRAVRLTLQVLLGLDHAHGQGVVHRDIKPGNVLVTAAAGRERAKVADFGLARAYQASALSGVTMTGTAAGTPGFMPPEQVTDFRTAKPAADQYSTAAMLYHLLTGAYVYEATNVAERLRKVLTEEPVRLERRRADVPMGLADVIHKALARRAEERFADVRGLAQALAAYG